MAYGASPYDEPLKTAWASFCDHLKAAGDYVFKDANPAAALHRAAGFRYLTQNMSHAFDFALETWNTRYPALMVIDSPTRKLGSQNADGIYLQAWIDGQSVYRLSGKKGTARFLNIAAHDGPPSASAYGTTLRPTGTARSSSSSAGSGRGATGCRPRRTPARSSSGSSSTAGTRSRPRSASNGWTWMALAPCRRPRT
jgi:hypothetical protein